MVRTAILLSGPGRIPDFYSRSSTEQLELLRRVESRYIIKKVADDTVTLRSSIASTANSQIDTHSINSHRLSSVGDTEFEFDDALLTTLPYQRPRVLSQIGQLQSRQFQAGQFEGQPQFDASRGGSLRRGPSIGTSLSASDEGYASHNITPSHSVSANTSLYRGNSLGPNDSILPDHGRSKSVSFGAQPIQHNPGVRRWVSTSDAATLPSPGGSKRGKFINALKRLNTASRANLTSSPSRNAILSPSATSTRGRRGRESDITTSIDLTTQAGRNAPEIIKAAQSGARYDVERLIGSGHDIEECHFHSRRNALMVAAHCGKEDIVDLLIQNNANINRTDASGSTALHLAASRGHLGAVDLLLMEAIDLETGTRQGRTALWVSANNGHVQTTQLLLERRAKVNARADNQMTALHVAARQGDIEIASLLVSYGADVDARDASMMTALHYACEGGHSNVIELLLNNKANIDAPGTERSTPLICAATAGQLLAVQLLIKRKAKFKCLDEGGMTALHWASYKGHVEIVDFLSSHLRGSLGLTNSQGRTPLHLAAMNSQFAVVEYLVRKNCPLETRCMSGLDALHYACRADNTEIVRLLLTSGANLESETQVAQQRPIHIAAAGLSVGMITLLCEKQASLEARDAAGDRALCVAARHGHVAAVQTLLKYGSPIQLRFGIRSHEDSPLCLAAKGGHLPVVSLLISSGASVLSKDEMGWPPIRYAAYYGHPEVLQELIAADPSAVNVDYGFSPESFGRFPDNIGFAREANISAPRKKRVLEILNESQDWSARTDATMPSNRASVVYNSNVESTNTPASTFSHASYAPRSGLPTASNDPPTYELAGTLEQGLPSSRSATPDYMQRGERDPDHSQDEDLRQLSNPVLSTLYENPRANVTSSDSLPERRPQIVSPRAVLPAETLTRSLRQLCLKPALDEVETPASSEMPELEGDVSNSNILRQEQRTAPQCIPNRFESSDKSQKKKTFESHTYDKPHTPKNFPSTFVKLGATSGPLDMYGQFPDLQHNSDNSSSDP